MLNTTNLALKTSMSTCSENTSFYTMLRPNANMGLNNICMIRRRTYFATSFLIITFSCKLGDTEQWHEREHIPLPELTRPRSNKLFLQEKLTSGHPATKNPRLATAYELQILTTFHQARQTVNQLTSGNPLPQEYISLKFKSRGLYHCILEQ